MLKHEFTLQSFRDRLAHYEALPQLVVLGLASGLLTGAVMVLFRLAVEAPLTYWLGDPEQFEQLQHHERFIWLMVGSLVLITLAYLWPSDFRKVGVVHLLGRLSHHQGNIAGRSLLMQFISAATALISGHSAGREGPAIFLGAACSSLLGQKLGLPNNSMRLLVACGAAAAISAAFSTPLAGVIFAMEVILLEYSIIGFTPVIVAAVSGDLVMRTVLGHENAFNVPLFQISNLAEIPWIMLLGVTVGICAALFNHLMLKTVILVKWNIASRLFLAGLLTGGVALLYPQVMGVGYDTITEALTGQMDIWLIVFLLLAKLILTPIILGLGVPAGLIGPTLFIGALIGAAFGFFGDYFSDMQISHTGLYVMLGMGAMMGAVLNAPLAALVALLELTGNTHIIFPGMIAIVISNLTVRYVFNLPSIFVSALQVQGLDYRQEPLAQVLSRSAVGSLMERNLVVTDASLAVSATEQLLAVRPAWLIIQSDKASESAVMPYKDFAAYTKMHPEIEAELNLLEIPAERFDINAISFRATLHEALNMMDEKHIDQLCVTSNQDEIIGVLTRQQIEYYYTHKQAI